MNFASVLKDFNWVVGILKSSKTKSQMECATKCFLLWEKKHTSNKMHMEELKSINKLKSTFWSIFKSKKFIYEDSFSIQK